MWKIIIPSLFVVVQASNVDQFLGTWTQVAFYPITGYIPSCIQFSFEKSTVNTDCVCVDGKTATLVEISLLLNEGNVSVKAAVDSYPMLAVDNNKEVPLDVDCTCGDKFYTTRVNAKLVNPNYFVMYEKNKNKQYTESEPNDAYVFSKKVDKHADLLITLQNIPDLKTRRGAGMCASDVNLEDS